MQIVKIVMGRCAAGVLVLFLIATITFFGSSLIGWHPESYLLGSDASASDIRELRASLGLDLPVYSQYWNWLTGVFQGDFGTSWRTSLPVGSLIGDKISITLLIVLGALALAVVIGSIVGTIAALNKGKKVDKAMVGGVSTFQAIPEFWLAMVLVMLFSLKLGILPATGYVAFSDSPMDWLKSITLPWLALAIPTGANIARHVRSASLSELGGGYVKWMESMGFGRNYIASSAVLRNAFSTVAPIVALQGLALLSMSIIVERIFAIQGMGGLVVDSALNQDIPVLLMGVLVYGVIVIIMNLVADIVQALLNPKMAVA